MLLKYMKPWVPFVKNGSKTHTMRKHRKNHPKVGETLHEYEGKGQVCGPLIRNDRTLNGWQEVRMFCPDKGPIKVYIDGWLLSFEAFNLLLWNDGFRGKNAMTEFRKFFFKEAKWWQGQIFHTNEFRYVEGIDYVDAMVDKFQLTIPFDHGNE